MTPQVLILRIQLTSNHGPLPYNNIRHPDIHCLPMGLANYGYLLHPNDNQTHHKKNIIWLGNALHGHIASVLIELKDDSHLIVAIILWLLASIYFDAFTGWEAYS